MGHGVGVEQRHGLVRIVQLRNHLQQAAALKAAIVAALAEGVDPHVCGATTGSGLLD